ncbi:MAG: preprotein translocase subunit SecG [Holosporales bacterium]|jgi:preprotein translocase subunit SecG|nr:preprotein translocase subunit SecG [Holosporales bacterium]
MIVAFLILHVFVTIAMIGLILLQKSDSSGPLGIGGGGGQGSLFTARGVANVLTRTTAVLAALFIGNCILIGVLTDRESKEEGSFFTSTKKAKHKAADADVDASKVDAEKTKAGEHPPADSGSADKNAMQSAEPNAEVEDAPESNNADNGDEDNDASADSSSDEQSTEPEPTANSDGGGE